MKRISAVFTLMIPAAPTPCSTRAAVSVGSDQLSAQTSEAPVNSSQPDPYTRRNPKISPSDANGSRQATSASW